MHGYNRGLPSLIDDFEPGGTSWFSADPIPNLKLVASDGSPTGLVKLGVLGRHWSCSAR